MILKEFGGIVKSALSNMVLYTWKVYTAALDSGYDRMMVTMIKGTSTTPLITE